jgi:hypothetical protein
LNKGKFMRLRHEDNKGAWQPCVPGRRAMNEPAQGEIIEERNIDAWKATIRLEGGNREGDVVGVITLRTPTGPRALEFCAFPSLEAARQEIEGVLG